MLDQQSVYFFSKYVRLSKFPSIYFCIAACKMATKNTRNSPKSSFSGLFLNLASASPYD